MTETKKDAETTRYDAGMAVRRQVLGSAHVDRANAKLTEFNSEFQNLITRYAWGDIWTRPGLSRHTRSCSVLSMGWSRGIPKR